MLKTRPVVAFATPALAQNFGNPTPPPAMPAGSQRQAVFL